MSNLESTDLETLRKKIQQFNEAYEKGFPIVSDFVYDFYKKKLSILEQNSSLKISDQIGYDLSNSDSYSNSKISHLFPILSLQHDFGVSAIEKFITRINKTVDAFPLIAEVKIDGVSIVARYENGFLQHIATRGNSEIGENITFLKDYLNLPEQIFLMQKLELRFEAYIHKNLIKNPRNAVAGALLKHSADIILKHIHFAPHNLYCHEKIWDNYVHLRQIFQQMHINPIAPYKICETIEDAQIFFAQTNAIKNDLPFEIDGIVFKVNDFEKQQMLGATAHSPKFAFAVKFENSFAISKILDIKFQVGRFGKITPVAIIEDAIIENRVIQKATLNNFANLQKNNYTLGDIVKIEMAGQVIPMISDIIEKSKNRLNLPTRCPACDSNLDNDICNMNWDCNGQVLERLSHFASKNGLDINGMGQKQIEFFMQQNLLKYPYDFFELHKKIDAITHNPSWLGEKSVQNLLAAIQKAKYSSYEQWLSSLGITNIGKNKSKILCEKFTNFEDFLNASAQDLEFLGKEIAKNVFEYKTKEMFWITKTWNYMKIGQKFIENENLVTLF